MMHHWVYPRRTVCQERQRSNPQRGSKGGVWGGKPVGVPLPAAPGGFINPLFFASIFASSFVMHFFWFFRFLNRFRVPFWNHFAYFLFIFALFFRSSFGHIFGSVFSWFLYPWNLEKYGFTIVKAWFSQNHLFEKRLVLDAILDPFLHHYSLFLNHFPVLFRHRFLHRFLEALFRLFAGNGSQNGSHLAPPGAQERCKKRHHLRRAYF